MFGRLKISLLDLKKELSNMVVVTLRLSFLLLMILVLWIKWME